ncbi:hypothetical protein GGF43_006922, partial [Coemansia sp. RSA 2618]
FFVELLVDSELSQADAAFGLSGAIFRRDAEAGGRSGNSGAVDDCADGLDAELPGTRLNLAL